MAAPQGERVPEYKQRQRRTVDNLSNRDDRCSTVTGTDRAGKRTTLCRSLWTKERASSKRILQTETHHPLIDAQLWVFNPDLRYSSSSSGHSVNDQQAMKVFYQEKDDVDKLLAPEIGQPSPLSVEELELPSMIFQALSDALHRSSQMLPVSARKFNEWQVGLLSRFSREKAT